MDMRGLAHFIQDIRKVTSNKDEEQKRINLELGKIRAKFKDSNGLSTYDRRKYVCKLMFISMLGYPVEFGHMEGVQLLAMHGAAEKLIGYLCLTVFLHEGHELMTLTTHIVNMDLISGKDMNTSLALTAIANAGGRDFCEAMAEGICRVILKSPVFQLRKKALLTYLRVWRKYREVADVTDVVPLAVEWINHPQFGIACAAITFLTGVIAEKEDHPELFTGVPAAITKLLAKIILDKHTEPEYIYYGVPAPWLQAKALHLLQHFALFPEGDSQRAQLLTIISKIVKATEKVVKDAQSLQKQRGTANRSNAMNSVLIELTSLAIHWNLDSKVLGECTDVVSCFVNDKKDANMRYIGLMLMTRLSLVSTSLSGFDFAAHCKQYQQQISVALHDADVSLRKKALMLTYSMSTQRNAGEIVSELIRFLPSVQGSFKRDLVLVVCALAEKFASDVVWYVDTVMAVVAVAGEHVPDDVWHRLVHVVISEPSVQKHAVESIFRYLSQPGRTSAGRTSMSNAAGPSASGDESRCPEPVVRVAAILLGEFGYQIALNSNSSPMDQVLVVQARLPFVTPATKAMLLTTLVKFYNLFDSAAVRERIIKILTSYLGNIDPEIQQRATEYLALIRTASDAVLQAALEPLPFMEVEMGRIFRLLDPSTKSTNQLGRDLAPSADVWAEKERARDSSDAKGSVLARTPADVPAGATGAVQGVTAAPAAATANKYADPAVTAADTPPLAGAQQPLPSAILDNLFGGVLEPQPVPVAPPSTSILSTPTPQQVSSWFNALCYRKPSGVLYEDGLVSVTVTQELRNADVRLSLTVKCVSSNPIDSLSVKLASTSASLLVQSREHPTTIVPFASVKIDFAARSLAPFKEPPTIRFVFSSPALSSRPRSLILSLPIVSSAFCAPYRLDEPAKIEALFANTPAGGGAEFEHKWRATALLETHSVVSALQALRLYTVQLPTGGSNDIVGIGAHATQPGSTTQFAPVLVRVRLASDGLVSLRVRNPSADLQSVFGDAFLYLVDPSVHASTR